LVAEHAQEDRALLNKRIQELHLGDYSQDFLVWYREQWLRDRTQDIKDGKDFKFVKMGDGEIACMLGEKGQTCNGDIYTTDLQRILINSYKQLKNDWISDWRLDRQDQKKELHKKIGITKTIHHDVLLHRIGELTPALHDFYKAIRDSKRRKVFIGPEKLRPIIKLLKIDAFLPIPENNAVVGAFDYPEGDIYLFSAGFLTKCLVPSILGTCIDLGSAFDPLVSQTRTNQVSKAELEKFYEDCKY